MSEVEWAVAQMQTRHEFRREHWPKADDRNIMRIHSAEYGMMFGDLDDALTLIESLRAELQRKDEEIEKYRRLLTQPSGTADPMQPSLHNLIVALDEERERSTALHEEIERLKAENERLREYQSFVKNYGVPPKGARHIPD